MEVRAAPQTPDNGSGKVTVRYGKYEIVVEGEASPATVEAVLGMLRGK